MRYFFSILILLLSVALFACNVSARRSRKAIGPSVSALLLSLIPPMLGNMIIISSYNQTVSTVGCYVYFLGMDLVMFALLRFTTAYCALPRKLEKGFIIFYLLLIADSLQLLCNLRFGHAFSTEAIEFSGHPYYRLVPHFGQTFHRAVDYSIFFAVLVIFVVKMIRSPRINSERYSIILMTMLITGLWQTFYIFSRTPLDRSMVGYGVFGLLVYFFSLRYRPMRLLDQMLASIASGLPDALFFFDAANHCIWANDPGIRLVGIQADDFDPAAERLRRLFGSYEQQKDGWSSQFVVGKDAEAKSYLVEKHIVADNKQRIMGSFLSIRDNTVEQRTLHEEIFKATHDSLTHVYNRAGYDLLLSRLNLSTAILLLFDVDHFKQVNDTFGHEMGDRVLIRTAQTIRQHFRADDCICRIGGDEFVTLLEHTDQDQMAVICSRLDQINAELSRSDGKMPPVSVSVGVAYGTWAATPAELFEHADHALYQAKENGRSGYVFYDSPDAQKNAPAPREQAGGAE